MTKYDIKTLKNMYVVYDPKILMLFSHVFLFAFSQYRRELQLFKLVHMAELFF